VSAKGVLSFRLQRWLVPTIAVVAAFIVCVVSPVITYRNVHDFDRTVNLVSHTQEVVAETERILTDLVEAEASTFAFLLSGQESYLARLDRLTLNLSSRGERLASLVQDNQDQSAKQLDLMEHVQAKLESLRTILRNRPSTTQSLDENWRVIESGEEQMASVRKAVGNFSKTEGALLAARTSQSTNQLAWTGTLLLFSTLVSIALVPAICYLLYLYWNLQHTTDVVTRKHIQERDELARYNQRLLESTGDGIYGIDKEGRCTFMNRAGALTLGGKAEDFLGKDMHKLIHHSKPDGSPFPLKECAIYKCTRLGDGCRVEDEVFWRADGKAVTVEYSSFPLRNGERIEGAVVSFSDISARLRSRQELEDAKAEAEFANESKSQFLANMSHELRTPLNAVIMYSELLAEESEEQNVPSFVPDLMRIKAAGKHLLELVNGLLDLSKVEAGKMDLYPEEIEVDVLVKEVLETIEPLVTKSKNLLVSNVASDARSMVGDVTKIRQVLFNLLSNANKFTHEGRIEVQVTRDAMARTIRFVVTDSGIGMSEEQQNRLFQPFMQADASTTRKYGGTGLGLAIIKRFTVLMGGAVEVHSVENQGSTFKVTLPERILGIGPTEPEHSIGIATSPNDGIANIAGNNQQTPLVLVIDDDLAVRDILTRVLVAEGMRCITAKNGRDGLSKAHSYRPDVIILDVLMPKVDGWSVISSLKANPHLAQVPVIMQSVRDDRDLGFMLGASEYLVKPVERKTLIQLLKKYTNALDSYILVVDDDESTRRLLARTLKREGWSTVEADNGIQGLLEIEKKPPVLIILDLMMPEMDGFEFLQTLRSKTSAIDIPVVVLTSKDLTSQDRLKLNGGVERILEKGQLNRDRFLDEVKRTVHSLTSSHRLR